MITHCNICSYLFAISCSKGACIDFFKYLLNEREFTLPDLIEKINEHIFRILNIRFLNNGYQSDREPQDPWWDRRHRHLSYGFRLDRLTNNEEFWVMREWNRRDHLEFPCDHEYIYDEEYGEDLCHRCWCTRSSIESHVPLEWEDPPYEEPPKEETYDELYLSNQLEKAKENMNE